MYHSYINMLDKPVGLNVTEKSTVKLSNLFKKYVTNVSGDRIGNSRFLGLSRNT